MLSLAKEYQTNMWQIKFLQKREKSFGKKCESDIYEVSHEGK